MVKFSPERRTIDFGDHWLRVILIILLVGALDGFVRAVLFPSSCEYGKFFCVIGRSGSLKYLQLLAWTRHFARDAVLLAPAVILRFFIVRRPLFQFHGFFLTSIAITALAGIVLFSRGFVVMGKNLGIFLVVCGLYRLLSLRRKR